MPSIPIEEVQRRCWLFEENPATSGVLISARRLIACRCSKAQRSLLRFGDLARLDLFNELRKPLSASSVRASASSPIERTTDLSASRSEATCWSSSIEKDSSVLWW